MLARRFPVRSHCDSQCARGGFTLLEFVAATLILVVSLAILAPAIQVGRESDRRVTCRAHLKEIGTALLAHEAAQGRFVSNGWSYVWVGDPDRGSGRKQPGGWIYNVLPYLGRSDIHDLPKGLQGEARLKAAAEMTGQPVVWFNCPTRRAAFPRPYDVAWVPRNAALTTTAQKSDYAINAGDVVIASGVGPASLEEGDSPSYPWKDFRSATGISYMRSEVTRDRILDGFSNTYLAGEKYVQTSGTDLGDDQGMYVGYDTDTARWALATMTPRRDSAAPADLSFGSAHGDVCHFVFCDGSVKAIAFRINGEVHRRLGNRRDGPSP